MTDEFAQEVEKLNNLMEAAFGERPLFQHMPIEDYWTWMTRLNTYWIERMSATVAAYAAKKGTDE